MSSSSTTSTKLVVSGLTGREGTFHGLRNRDYGTDLVAGVTPGKGGQDVDGVPVFDTIEEAVAERGANTSMVFVPAAVRRRGDRRGDRRRRRDGDRDHRGHPGARHAEDLLEGAGRGRAADRPQLPGRASPGKANVGIIPAAVLRRGHDRGRLQVGHAHLPDRQRAEAGGPRQLDDRRHRRRPDRRLGLHRHPDPVRGRRRDRADRHGAARSAATRRSAPRTSSPSRCRSPSSATSPASPRPRASRWAMPGRSSPAPRAPPRRRRTRSRRRACGWARAPPRPRRSRSRRWAASGYRSPVGNPGRGASVSPRDGGPKPARAELDHERRCRPTGGSPSRSPCPGARRPGTTAASARSGA